MSVRQGIEIDFCPNCRGVWLDRGELDKILERSTATEAPPKPVYGLDHRASAHSYGGSNYYQHKKKKKGGILGELSYF